VAISSPYVGQGPKGRDPLDYMQMGMQLGSQMMQLGQMMHGMRMDNLKVKADTFSNIVKSTGGGLTEAAKQNEESLV
jgi:hypothetical protein